jgi:hypothetical protein
MKLLEKVKERSFFILESYPLIFYVIFCNELLFGFSESRSRRGG